MPSLPRQSDRAFGLTFAAVFAVIGAIGFFAFGAVLNWAWVIAAMFLFFALALPWLLLPLNRLWMSFAGRLGQIMNFILLGIFFYVLILPFGLIVRLFTDPLCRKRSPDATTYWSAVGRKADAETYRDLF